MAHEPELLHVRGVNGERSLTIQVFYSLSLEREENNELFWILPVRADGEADCLWGSPPNRGRSISDPPRGEDFLFFF